MRKILFAGVAALSLIVFSPSQPARADLPVIDVTAIGHMLEELGLQGQQLDEAIQTLAEIVQVYNETVQVYNMATNIWNSVAENVGVGGIASDLTAAFLRNPLPYGTTQHPGYIGGLNDPSGLPFGGQYVTQNTVGGNPGIYDDDTFMGKEIKKRIYSISAAQALATNHMLSAEQRLIGTAGLFAWLANMNTIQQTDSLGSRLKTELNYINTQHVQMQGMLASAQAQKDVFEHNRVQWTYQDETLGIKAACQTLAATGAGVTSPACK